MALDVQTTRKLSYALGSRTAAQDLQGDLDTVSGDYLDSDNVAANVALLEQDISAAYVEAEVQAISDKVDALIGALITAGLMSAS